MRYISSDPTLDWIVFATIAAGAAVAFPMLIRPLSARLRALLWISLSLRLAGPILYYELSLLSNTGVDAFDYYVYGLAYADAITNLDSTAIFARLHPGGAGTNFISLVCGAILCVIGPNIRSLFLIFSLGAFIGLLLPILREANYLAAPLSRNLYIGSLLLPSLWFWPATAGKDALLLLALGLLVTGLHGPRPRWGRILSAVCIAIAVRPHVGIAFVCGIAFALVWAIERHERTGRNVLRVAVPLLVGATVIPFALARIGIVEPSISAIQAFAEERSATALQGGSLLEPITDGPAGTVLQGAFFMFRPLPWEITNALAALCALEIVAFWFMVGTTFSRPQRTRSRPRESRVMPVCAAVTAACISFGVGGAAHNLGGLIRQRVTPLALLSCAAFLRRSEGPSAAQANRAYRANTRS